MARLVLLAVSAAVLNACGGGSTAPTKSAAVPAAAAPAPQAATALPAADEPVIDVCGLFPRGPIEAALGKIDRTRNLNITDAKAPVRTPGGSGGCFWEGPKLGLHVRMEVHTARALARDGFSSPRRFIDMGWAIGPDAAAVEGLGEVARVRPRQGKSIELIAGSADRSVHLMADGITREQAVAIVRAGLEQMKLR